MMVLAFLRFLPIVKPVLFARHRFPPDVKRQLVRRYSRFTWSFQHIENLRTRRGIEVSYETIRM